jgi:hypothetical protein
MKKIFLSAIAFAVAFGAWAQDEGKPDFPAQKIADIGKVSKKPIPDTYLIFFDEEQMQPYVKKRDTSIFWGLRKKFV